MWLSLYRRRVGDELLTYSREFFGPHMRKFDQRVHLLVDLGMQPGDRVLVTGCAFGFLLEPLLDRGIDVWGIELSSWIHHNLRNQSREDVVDRIMHGDALNLVEHWDWIVDEDMITALDDRSARAFLRRAARHTGRVVHLVSTGDAGDSAINWKSLEAWEAMAPDQEWFDIRSVGDLENQGS